jgi:hypothetical protein
MDEFRKASQLTMSAAGPVMRSAMSRMSDMTLSSEVAGDRGHRGAGTTAGAIVVRRGSVSTNVT